MPEEISKRNTGNTFGEIPREILEISEGICGQKLGDR